MAKLDLEGDDTHAATVEVVGMRQSVGVSRGGGGGRSRAVTTAAMWFECWQGRPGRVVVQCNARERNPQWGSGLCGGRSATGVSGLPKSNQTLPEVCR